MSQMPDSVYMNKDAKYNTCGTDIVCTEFYLLTENEFDDKCLEDYVEYTPTYRLEEAVRNAIEKACDWVEQHASEYCGRSEYMAEDLRKAMED